MKRQIQSMAAVGALAASLGLAACGTSSSTSSTGTTVGASASSGSGSAQAVCVSEVTDWAAYIARQGMTGTAMGSLNSAAGMSDPIDDPVSTDANMIYKAVASGVATNQAISSVAATISNQCQTFVSDGDYIPVGP